MDATTRRAHQPRGTTTPPTTHNTRPTHTATLVETAIETKERYTALADELTALADETYRAMHGVDAARPTSQAPEIFLYASAAWISRQPYAAEYTTVLSRIRTQLARILGYAPDKADFHCPHCTIRNTGTPSPRLERYPTNDGLPTLYTCPACSYAGIIDKPGEWNNWQGTNTLETTWRLRLAETDTALPPRQAAEVFHVPYSTVRTWIERHQLTKTNGKIRLKDLAKTIKERSKAND